MVEVFLPKKDLFYVRNVSTGFRVYLKGTYNINTITFLFFFLSILGSRDKNERKLNSFTNREIFEISFNVSDRSLFPQDSCDYFYYLNFQFPFCFRGVQD